MRLNISKLRRHYQCLSDGESHVICQLLNIVESQKKIRQLYDEIGIVIDADKSLGELYSRADEEQVRCNKLLDDVEVSE